MPNQANILAEKADAQGVLPDLFLVPEESNDALLS
jgi:hypothetical protein